MYVQRLHDKYPFQYFFSKKLNVHLDYSDFKNQNVFDKLLVTTDKV